MKSAEILASLEAKHPGEKEFLQAVKEVLLSVEEVYNQHPEFEKASIIERLVEPDRIITFRVPWIDDAGKVHVNIGYRVQFNNAIGPYKADRALAARVGCGCCLSGPSCHWRIAPAGPGRRCTVSQRRNVKQRTPGAAGPHRLKARDGGW